MNLVFTSLKSRPGVYWGQKGEDYHIHKHYFPTLRNGTFLEMGALMESSIQIRSFLKIL